MVRWKPELQNLTEGRKSLSEAIELFQPNWSWKGQDFRLIEEGNEAFLKSFIIEPCLNLCSGQSQHGLRVDIDPTVRPDILASVQKPPFKEDSFATVICDPPFNYYSNFAWIKRLGLIAKRRIILSTSMVLPNIRNFKRSHVFYIENPIGRFMRIWQVFDRQTSLLLESGIKS